MHVLCILQIHSKAPWAWEVHAECSADKFSSLVRAQCAPVIYLSWVLGLLVWFSAHFCGFLGWFCIQIISVVQRSNVRTVVKVCPCGQHSKSLDPEKSFPKHFRIWNTKHWCTLATKYWCRPMPINIDSPHLVPQTLNLNSNLWIPQSACEFISAPNSNPVGRKQLCRWFVIVLDILLWSFLFCLLFYSAERHVYQPSLAPNTVECFTRVRKVTGSRPRGRDWHSCSKTLTNVLQSFV